MARMNNKLQDGGDTILYCMPKMDYHKKLMRNACDKKKDIHVKKFVPYKDDTYMGVYRIQHINKNIALLRRVKCFN